MELSGSSEVLVIAIANVTVLTYNANTKHWQEAKSTDPASPESSLNPSTVFLLHDNVYSNVRVVARKQSRLQEVLVNCLVGPGLQYKLPTPRFFEWRDVKTSSVYGFNFSSEADADNFVKSMQAVIALVGKSQKAPNSKPTSGSSKGTRGSKIEGVLPQHKTVGTMGTLGTNSINNAKRHQAPPLKLDIDGQVSRQSVLSSIPLPSSSISPFSLSPSSLAANLDIQNRPLPPLPPEDTPPAHVLIERSKQLPGSQTASTTYGKKAPSAPMPAKSDISKTSILPSSRPKTLLPSPSVSNTPPTLQNSSKVSPSSGAPPPPPPPPPLPPLAPTPVSHGIPAKVPGKTKRSQSVGLLDAISTVQLKKLETLNDEATLGKMSRNDGGGSGYLDMISEITQKLKKRMDQTTEDSSESPGKEETQRPLSSSSSSETSKSMFSHRSLSTGRTANRPVGASQTLGRGFPKKSVQHAESLTCGQATLPSVSENHSGMGYEGLAENIDALRKDLDRVRCDLSNQLSKFKDDIIMALKVELNRR